MPSVWTYRTRGRGNALSGDHYCCHKGVEKGKEGESRLGPRPSIAGAEVIYRHCPADRYRASGELSPPGIVEELHPSFYILVSIIGNWHELVIGS